MLATVLGARLEFLSLLLLTSGAAATAGRDRRQALRPQVSQQRAGATSKEHAVPVSLHQEHEVAEAAFSYNIPRPVKIVVWSKVAQSYRHAKNLQGCNLDLTYALHDGHRHGVTLNPDVDISGADVVIFNVAMLSRQYLLPRHKYQGQLWIAYCSEPVFFDNDGLDAGDCRLLKDPATMSVMDAVSSYDGFSDFPSYFTPPTETQMRRERGWSADSTPQALATFASSDCRSKGRIERITQLNASFEALGKHRAVLSYGDCLNTVEETFCGGPQAVQKEEWSDMVVSIVNRCMARQFALVVENTDEPWYITEKLWFAFASGSVPVYYGAEEVKKLVPPGSIIFAKDYDSPGALASALASFSSEDLEQAQAFKGRPVSEWGAWATARRFSHMTLLPRICEAAASRPPVAPDAPRIETPRSPSPTDRRPYTPGSTATAAASLYAAPHLARAPVPDSVSTASLLRGAAGLMAAESQRSQPCRALPCCGRSPAGCAA